MDIPILLNHQDFLVVDKPAGVAVADTEGRIGLLRRLGDQVGEHVYPVHRLDAGTSGALIVARNPQANRELSMQFAARGVDKTYLALSYKKPLKKQGLVCGDMAKARRGAWKLLPSRDNPAITRFVSRGLEGVRLFVVFPQTGKTHQIRVALRSVGAPIIGDELYGGEPAERLHLHAYQLGFSYSGQRILVSAPPPGVAEFARLSESVLIWVNEQCEKRHQSAPARVD